LSDKNKNISNIKPIKALGVHLHDKDWDKNVGLTIISFYPGKNRVWDEISFHDVDNVEKKTPESFARYLDDFIVTNSIHAVGIDSPQSWRFPIGWRPPEDAPPMFKKYVALKDKKKSKRTKGKYKWKQRGGRLCDEYFKSYYVGTFDGEAEGSKRDAAEFSISVYTWLLNKGYGRLVNDVKDRNLKPLKSDRYYLLESFLISAKILEPISKHQEEVEYYRRLYNFPINVNPTQKKHTQALIAALPAVALLGGPCEAHPFGYPAQKVSKPEMFEGLCWESIPLNSLSYKHNRPAIYLQKLTIHGIGPFRDKHAISIKPLTLLCGENGKGKSTWLGILDKLRDASWSSNFPFFFFLNKIKQKQPPEEDNYLSRYNFITPPVNEVLLRQGGATDIQDVQNLDSFGLPGTFGLMLLSKHSTTLPPATAMPPSRRKLSKELKFFWNGVCEENMIFNIRITTPYTSGFYAKEIPEYYLRSINDFTVGFDINGKTAVELILDKGWEECKDKSPFCRLLVNSDLLKTSSKSTMVELAHISLEINKNSFNHEIQVVNNKALEASDKALSKILVGRIRQILEITLDNYFHLHAVRGIPEVKSSKLTTLRKLGRNVGHDGKYAHQLASEYASIEVDIINEHKLDLPSTKKINFHSYYSMCLEQLLNIRLLKDQPEVFCNRESFISVEVGNYPQRLRAEEMKIQNGLIFRIDRVRDEHDNWDDQFFDGPYVAIDHYYSSYFGDSYTNDNMVLSSGFHQLAPIVIQAGLMRRNEIFAIENPEVHLHPRAQVRIAEFLLENAKVGKSVIIETHSDLIVQRIVRAIVENDIELEDVGIYFIDSDIEKNGYEVSKVETVKYDRDGLIKNWPKGFLDESIAELQRMIGAKHSKYLHDGDD